MQTPRFLPPLPLEIEKHTSPRPCEWCGAKTTYRFIMKPDTMKTVQVYRCRKCSANDSTEK